MDKDTLKQLYEYCVERAKASKVIEDKLYNELQNYQYDDTDAIELRGNFYKESGRLNAFLELANKLMDIIEEDTPCL